MTTLTDKELLIWVRDNITRFIRLTDGRKVRLQGFLGKGNIAVVENDNEGILEDVPFSSVTGFADGNNRERFSAAAINKRCTACRTSGYPCHRAAGHAGEHMNMHGHDLSRWGTPIEYAKPKPGYGGTRDEIGVINYDVGTVYREDRAPPRDIKALGDSHAVIQRNSIEEETLKLREQLEILNRFVCELNLQDHPRAVQQRQRELIHTAKKMLKPEGNGK